MIQLDSSHPFDWAESTRYFREDIASLAKTLSLRSSPDSILDVSSVEADVTPFGRQVPCFVSAFLAWDFGFSGRSYGVDPVTATDIPSIRRSLREDPGLARVLGEGFLPMFHIVGGVTLYVYLPKQTEPCADSFVVAAHVVPAGWHFVANSTRKCLSLLGAIVQCREAGYPERLGSSVPPILREWLL